MLPTNTKNNYTTGFNDPRLSMTLPGRFLVRVVSYIGYLLIIATTFTLFISNPPPWLPVIGGFLFILLIDRVVHSGEGDYPLSELPRSGTINAARYIRPRAFSVIEKAYDKSLVMRRNFFLQSIYELLDHKEVEEKTGGKVLSVFVPTTPNPTSGFLLMVPEADVIKLEMSVADGIKFIISLGAVAPGYAGSPTLAAHPPA